MFFQNSLNNIWRNARHLNNLVVQIETTKRIQRPSDDPQIANRALRYRTILSETEQFMSNSERGLAWMEVSEAAFMNILSGTPSNPSIMQRINTRLVAGAQTGTNNIDNMRAIIEDIRQFKYQLTGVEMNQTYMGRYVFSGFHTDEPPILKHDRPDSSYIIQHTFNRRDIWEAEAFSRVSPTDRPELHYVNILHLPFTNVSFAAADNVAGAPALGLEGGLPGLPAPLPRFSNDLDAYNVPDGPAPIIHHIIDTGELVFNDAAKALLQDGMTITFRKDGLVEGDLNPRIYFPSWDVSGDPPPAAADIQSFNTQGQDIQLEVSGRTFITVNSHARDIVTSKLVADLRRLIDFADSLVATDPMLLREHFSNPPPPATPADALSGDELNQAVIDFLAFEEGAFVSLMHGRFNEMLRTHEYHMTVAQRAHTNMGSRMHRLDMIQVRLDEDEIAYSALLSETIDTDIAGTIARKNGAEAAFQNALMAVARATQLSLADFINR